MIPFGEGVHSLVPVYSGLSVDIEEERDVGCVQRRVALSCRMLAEDGDS